MNKFSRYFLFLLLPVIYFISSYVLKSAQGPYYLNFYDPSYVYLVSSLNIAQGFGVGHFDHPGTTVQMIGSVVVRLYFMLSGKSPEIQVDVLSRPEDYLFVINTVLISVNALVLFLLGLLAYKFSKNIYLSILLQLSPFTSMEMFYGSIIFSPDNFLISVSLLLICTLVYYWFQTGDGKPPSVKFILISGIICGLGLATKLNFIPLLFIPFFLIKGYRNKVYFWIFTVISFLLFIAPILVDIGTFAEWIERLVLNSGKYGKGDSNVVDTNLILPNLKMIFSKDAVFTISYITLIISFIISLIRYFSEITPGRNYFSKINGIMSVLLFAMTLQIILVAKHYAQYYLIPSMMLSVFVFIVCIYVIFPDSGKITAAAKPELWFTVVFVLISVWSAIKIFSSYEEAVIFKSEALRSEKFIKDNYPGNLLISSFSSASRECALAFAVRYGAKKRQEYEEIISERNKAQIFYDPWDIRLYKSSDPGNLKNDLLNKKNEKIILQLYFGTPESFVNKIDETCGVKGTEFKEVFSNKNGERIYEVSIGNK